MKLYIYAYNFKKKFINTKLIFFLTIAKIDLNTGTCLKFRQGPTFLRLHSYTNSKYGESILNEIQKFIFFLFVMKLRKIAS